MTGNEYQKLAMRTASIDSMENPHLNAVLGLNGEAGEIADMYKKAIFQGHEIDSIAILKELGDIMWYVALMCEAEGVTIEEIMEMNIEKLRKRYPDGFEVERSVNRNE